MFVNRIDAANQLANALALHRGKKPLVLAIPRGAVPMAKIIADQLDGDLDVVLVHKVGHPDNPEFAIGAIDEDGNFYTESEDSHIPIEDLAHLRNVQVSNLRKKRAKYTPYRSQISINHRDIIIVDDGVATGWTMKAAVHMLKRAGAQRVTVAVPVGAAGSIEELSKIADEVVCLEIPPFFQAVGQFFENFDQVSDEDVIDILRASNRQPK